MKKGIILYVTEKKAEKTFDAAAVRAAKNLIPDATRIEVVSPGYGYFDINDAWWALIAKGMHQVFVKVAEYSLEEGLKLTGREMRLYG